MYYIIYDYLVLKKYFNYHLYNNNEIFMFNFDNSFM